MRLKPRVLLDIKRSPSTDIYCKRRKIVNLSHARKTAPAFKSWLLAPFLVLLPLFFLGSVIAPMGGGTLAQTVDTKEERAVLESQLQDLENQIAEYEKEINVQRTKGASLKGEINTLNAKINKLNLQIKAISLSLKKLDNEIVVTTTKIGETESDINSSKSVLVKTLNAVYQSDDQGLVEILLKNPKISDFFGSVNDILAVQDSIRISLERLKALKNDLVDQKESLNLERTDKAAAKAYQDSQRKDVESTKKEKDGLLKTTKGKESEYQKILAAKKAAAAEIRSRIFRLLGGGELPFGEAVKLAQVAEKATGVRAALVLSVLTQESAVNGVIGSNLGRCFYNDPRKNASGTVMSDSQKTAFLQITQELKIDPAATPVSCPIVSDGAYGGAMGPAQFMPGTWMLYKDRVASITGGNPPSPFNNLDAFTATALYLSDGLSSCKGVYDTLFSQENCAAAKYYAGKSWKRYISVGRYGYRVADRAQDFQKDIDLINS